MFPVRVPEEPMKTPIREVGFVQHLLAQRVQAITAQHSHVGLSTPFSSRCSSAPFPTPTLEGSITTWRRRVKRREGYQPQFFSFRERTHYVGPQIGKDKELQCGVTIVWD